MWRCGRACTRCASASTRPTCARRLSAAGIPVPPYTILDPKSATPVTQQVEAFGATHGWPLVLKASRGGYDGKGVWPVANSARPRPPATGPRSPGVPLLVEAHVAIDFELAALVVRRPIETLAWSVVETTQVDGVCREVLMPGRVTPELAEKAQSIAIQIAETIDACRGDGRRDVRVGRGAHGQRGRAPTPQQRPLDDRGRDDLAVREPPPRGARPPARRHRLPLARTWPRSTCSGRPTARTRRPASERALGVPGAHVHLYGKEARPGRKLGHVTVCGDDAADVQNRAWHAAAELGTPVPASPPAPGRDQ